MKLMDHTIEELKELFKRYESDPNFDHMKEEGINFVPGTGPLDAEVMIIGEAPGRMENAKRQPFIGPAGRVLTELLENIGFDIVKDVYLTNVVKYWPRTSERRTRPPVEEEILYSKEYLEEEIEIVNPLVIGLCGRSPIGVFFPEIRNIKSVNGHLLKGDFVPLFHPAHMLYKPMERHEIESGYRALRTVVDAKSSD